MGCGRTSVQEKQNKACAEEASCESSHGLNSTGNNWNGNPKRGFVGTMIFHLKEKQPPIWKHSIHRVPAKVMNFSLSNPGAKPLTIAQTIFRHMTR